MTILKFNYSSSLRAISLAALMVLASCSKRKDDINYNADFMSIKTELKDVKEGMKDLKVKMKDVKEEMNKVKVELEKLQIALSNESSNYLYGVPPAPPYQKAEVVLSRFNTTDCGISDIKMVGYIISIEDDNGHEYVILQDVNGVRHKCYISGGSNADRSWLPYVLIPGNKAEMIVEYCGNGGYIYVREIKNLKRK